MNGKRKDVVDWLKENKKIDLPETTLDYYRRLGLIDDCIIDKIGKHHIFDVEKTGEKIAKILDLHINQRLTLYEIRDLLKNK